MFKRFVTWLFTPSLTAEEIYYANSTDLADLECRMKEVRFGNAPFQPQFRVY